MFWFFEINFIKSVAKSHHDAEVYHNISAMVEIKQKTDS